MCFVVEVVATKISSAATFFLGFGLFVIENSSIVNEAGLGDGCVIPL